MHLEKLAEILHKDEGASVNVASETERGDLARFYMEKYFSPKNRGKRWAGPYWFRLLQRIEIHSDLKENMNQNIKMKPGRYSLSRDGDAGGDAGGLLVSIDPKTGKRVGENGDIVVGCAIQCGSTYARTFENQDWWLTTPVTEILNQDKNEKGEVTLIRFKTRNSIYTLRSF